MIDLGGRRGSDRLATRDGAAKGEVHKGESLKLVIVDHHQLFGDCLAAVLAKEGRFEVVGRAASSREALDRLTQTRVDILLVTLETSMEGIRSLIQAVEERSPKSKVVLLGHDEAEERILECLEAGVNGYLVRDQSLAELRAGIEAVWRGDTVCTPRVAHSLFTRLARLGRERRRRNRLDYLTLTPRELEVLRLVADGLSNHEIARQLILSVHTVKNHIHKILETLGVNSRWEAVRYAVERGWLRDRRRR